MPPLLANRNDKSICDRLLVMWTKEEDDILRDQVKLHGIDKWAKIATQFCGKTSRQCRRRWHMFLNVVNKRGGWSADEDKLLLEAHRKFGNRWTEIAKKLQGRTDNAVKNRFCVLCKKQTKEAGVPPVQRSVDNNGSRGTKQKLQERRFLEGPKVMNSTGGVSKKLRTAANLHNRAPEVALEQRPLDQTLQQWKGLQSSEILTSSPLQHVSLEGSLQPWDSLQSNMLIQKNKQEERFHSWKQSAMEGKGGAICPRLKLTGNLQQWEGHSGAAVDDTTCPKSSLPGEPQPLKVMQSHIESIIPSNHSRGMQGNLHWKSSGNARSDPMHVQRALKKSHSTWSSANPIDAANNQLPQLGELLQWWKEVDKNMSNPGIQQRDDEALHHWEQNCQESVAISINHQRSVNENLPSLSETNSRATVYMSSSKQSTSVSSMRTWSTLQTGKQSEHMQQSDVGGVHNWDHLVAKEVCDNTSQLRSKETMHKWQGWKNNEAKTPSPCKQGSLENNTRIDKSNLEYSDEILSFQQASVQHISLWTIANSQQAPGSTVLHRPEGHQTHHWTHSKCETPTMTRNHLLEDTVQQWDKSEAVVNPGPLMTMLDHFAGGDSDAETQPSAQAEIQREDNSQLNEESWKIAAEKLKCSPTTFIADIQMHSPREVLEFEEYMSEGQKEIHVRTAAVFPTLMIHPHQASKAEDNSWELQTSDKGLEHGEMYAREGLLPENSTICETTVDLCEEANDGVDLMKIEGQASGVNESPPPDILSDGPHSPTQIVPRSHLTMECMPSPQFTESEKEFLLSTLDHTSTTCWSCSPLRPHSRFSKVRNPLIDIRHDTPARSPLSSCLLRQFQVSEASHLA